MNKYFAAFFIIAIAPGAPLFAQDKNLEKLFGEIDRMDNTGSPTPSSSPAPGPKGTPSPDQEPTIITATDKTTFEGQTKVAVLYGNVKVKNPQFTLSADKLTVYFNKDAETTKKDSGPKKQTGSPSPGPKPHASPSPKPSGAKPSPTDPTADQSSSIDKIIAEGNVVVESDRPDANGGPPTHYIGKGEKVVYTPATGEAVFTGWPQLQQGVNTMVATDDSTVILLNRDGTMDAKGPVKMNVQNSGTSAKAPAPDQTPEGK